MDKMMEEGGLTTDGAKVDPISGNEVPAGSNAEEVRDDVDAKLSEGEYVVPADVVRYFGVGYFEKLRKKAKESLAEMDAEGRMGGEPMPSAEEDLSDEEMDELTQVLNMANGGYVKGYAEGGLETDAVGQHFLTQGTQPMTDWSQYSTPGSFTAANRQGTQQGVQQQQPVAPASFVEYIGPNGQIMMVPVDAEGNPTIPVPEGYTKKGAVTAQSTGDDGGDPFGDTHRRAQEEAAKRDNDWFDKFHASDDPAAMAEALLEDAQGSGLPGMFGKLAGGADTLSDIGRIRGYASAIQGTNPDLAASLESIVDAKIKDSGFGIKALEGIIGTGKQYADMFSTRIADSTVARPTTRPTATTASRYSAPTAEQKTSFADKNKEAAKIAAQNKDDGESTQSAIDRHKEIFDKAKASGASAGVAGSAAAKSVTKDLSDKEKEGGAELDTSYGISGLAKGGLVKRPASKTPKAKKKPTNKKKGLGRK